MTAPVPLALVEDPDLEVHELDVAQVRVGLADRVAQRLVERVHRAVALGRAHEPLAADPDLDRRLGLHAAVLALLHDRAPGLQPEQRHVVARLPADQQVEGAVGRLQVVAAVLEVLHPVGHARGALVVEVRARLLGARLHRALAGKLGDQHAPVGPHLVRLHVLEGARVAVHAGHVHPALVGEGVEAHVGLVGVRRDVADLVDEVRGLGEAAEQLGRHHVEPELELEVREDRDQVGVAAALAVAVHRALHQARALLDRHQRVRHAAAGVVVGVDPDLHVVAQLGHDPRGDLGHPRGQRGAVGVAERHVLGARLGGRAQAAQRVRVVVGEGVEEVLGVVDHALALAAQEATESAIIRRFSSGSTRVTFSRCSDQVLPTSVHTRREAVGEHPQRLVVRGRHVLAPGHPEGRDLGVLEGLPREQVEQRLLLGVRAREAALHEVDAQPVERVGHAHLLVGGEGHALALHAVAEGGVVEEDLHAVSAFRLRVRNERVDGRQAVSVIRSCRTVLTPSMVQPPRRATRRSARRARAGRRRRPAGSAG